MRRHPMNQMHILYNIFSYKNVHNSPYMLLLGHGYNKRSMLDLNFLCIIKKKVFAYENVVILIEKQKKHYDFMKILSL